MVCATASLLTLAVPPLTEPKSANAIRLTLMLLLGLKAGLAVVVMTKYLAVRRLRPPGLEGTNRPHVVPLAVSHLISMWIIGTELYRRSQWSAPLGWVSVQAAFVVFLGAAGLVTLLRNLIREGRLYAATEDVT